VLVGSQHKASPEAHHAARIALRKNRGNAAAASALGFRKRAGHFLADHNAAERGRNDRFDGRVGEKCR
jgi:hypothetical protein